MKAILIIQILVLIFTCNILNANSQTVLVFIVSDVSTEEFVNKVNIDIRTENLTGITNEDGRCIFENVTERKVTVSFDRIGYIPLSKEFEISDTDRNIFFVKIRQTEIMSGEIKVYSTKIENQIRYAILPIALITKKDFSYLPIISASDVMKIKPGINIVRDGIWATDINIRGLSRDNIVVYINGSRVETANNQAARFSLIDENTIERIEVIKGGVSSIYGSGGIGGIVSIKTETGNFSDYFKMKGILSGELFSVNNLSGAAFSFMVSDKKFNASIYAAYREASDTRTPGGIISNSSFRDHGISVYTGFKLFKRHELNLQYQNFESPYAGIPGSYPLFPSKATVTYIPAERNMFSTNYKISNVSKLITNLSAGFFLQNIFRNVEVLPNSSVYIPASGTNPAMRINNISINPTGEHNSIGLLLQGDMQKGNSKFVIGIDTWQRKLTTTRIRSQQIIKYDTANNPVSFTDMITGDTPIPDSKYSSVGFYVNDETSFNNERFYVNIGGRIDGISVSNEESLNPQYTIMNGVVNNNPADQKVLWEAGETNDLSWSINTGINYKLTEQLNLSGNISTSFRSPSLEERYQYIDLGNIVRVGNPDLNSELGYFLSASLKYWGEDLNMSAEFFANFLSDLVSEIPGIYEDRTALIKTNIGKATLMGFDLQTDYNLLSFLTLYGNASYVYGEDTENNFSLPQIPPFNGIIGIKYPAGDLFSFNLNTVLFAQQNRTATGELKTPGYAVLNFYSDVTNLNINALSISLAAGIENIFDKSYRDHLSTSRGTYISEPGRNFFVKTKFIF